MPFLASQLARTGPYYDGRAPLPKRAERCVQLMVDDVLTIAQLAQRSGISERSIKRLRNHPAWQSRLIYLRERAADLAQADEPLAQKGRRIALAGAMARTLKDQLEANGYVTTLGVSKQGNPITGFDRARVAEIRQYLALIADELDDKGARQASDTLAVQVTMTTADAVTKVQALLSRTADDDDVYKERARAREAEATPMPLPRGVEGGNNGNEYDGKIETVLDTEYKQFSDAKEILEGE